MQGHGSGRRKDRQMDICTRADQTPAEAALHPSWKGPALPISKTSIPLDDGGCWCWDSARFSWGSHQCCSLLCRKDLVFLLTLISQKCLAPLFGDEIIFLVCSWSCEITLASDASGSSISKSLLDCQANRHKWFKRQSLQSLKPIFVGRDNEDHRPASHVRLLPQVPTLTKAGRFAIRCQVQIVIQLATEESA